MFRQDAHTPRAAPRFVDPDGLRCDCAPRLGASGNPHVLGGGADFHLVPMGTDAGGDFLRQVHVGGDDGGLGGNAETVPDEEVLQLPPKSMAIRRTSRADIAVGI